MALMAHGDTWRKRIYPTIGLVAALLVTSCSWRAGLVEPGTVPPPDGRRAGEKFVHEIEAFYVAPAEPGDDRLKRFGAAATLAADGTVWHVLVLAP